MEVFGQSWIVIPLVGLCAFIFSYVWADKVVQWLRERSLGQREEVIKRLDSMFVEINHRQITYAMLILSFGFGALVFLLVWPHFVLGTLLGIAVTIVGWAIPARVVKILYERRCSRFVDQMVDAMTIMSNGIKSGLSISQTMERVVEGMKSPIRQEFGLVLSQVRLGLSVEEALNNLGERVPKPDVQMFVTSINILKETGGNMAETFGTIAETIRERQKIQKKIEALTTQGITQGIILTLVPFIVFVVFFVADPAYVKPLVSTPAGWVMLAVMLGLQILGGLVIKKIVTIEV